MKTGDLHIEQKDLNKLLLCGSGDAALMYLYLKTGNDPQGAEADLQLSPSRRDCALAALRQLGLWEDRKDSGMVRGEPPRYTEGDVLRELETNQSFKLLQGELQRVLGRVLTTEDLKIVLGFSHYLGLPDDVISVLVCYCRESARNRGRLRTPSLRAIEKEAFFWADHGIDTLEEATAYIRRQNLKNSRRGRLLQILQITDRNPTDAEERYISQWLDMGFDDQALSMAYERTCINTGGLKWAYMNKILQRWHEAGLHTGAEVEKGDRKTAPTGGTGEIGEAEMEAIRRIMQEG